MLLLKILNWDFQSFWIFQIVFAQLTKTLVLGQGNPQNVTNERHRLVGKKIYFLRSKKRLGSRRSSVAKNWLHFKLYCKNMFWRSFLSTIIIDILTHFSSKLDLVTKGPEIFLAKIGEKWAITFWKFYFWETATLLENDTQKVKLWHLPFPRKWNYLKLNHF